MTNHKSPRPNPDWLAYRKELAETIKTPEYGILRHADSFVNDSNDSPRAAVFELLSGRYQREYITLWELFDHRDELDRCMEMFAEKAKEIRRVSPYSTIVTCAPTTRHILENVHAEIETKDEKVNLHYLDHYPFLGAESKQLLNFKDERVLIVTDVIATGVVVRDLAHFIEDMGGETVAALCVVLIDPRMIDRLEQSDGLPIIEYGRKPTRIRVHSLTDYAIPVVDAHEVTADRVISIDAVTILPEQTATLPNRFEPIFTTHEMFDHFEESKAISYDFYQQGNRRFATGLRVRRLLECKRDVVWAKIRHFFDGQPTIVTTFHRADMWFKNFVEEELNKERVKLNTVFIPRTESIEVPDCYSLVDNNRDWLEDRPVVLLLSSVHTSENLRNLASLLASASVKEITAVCLFNRMGSQTMNFVSRIERLLRGVGSGDGGAVRQSTNDHAGFEFKPVYAISELSDQNIAKMQGTIQTLLDHYSNETRVRSFQRQVNQARRQFESQTVTSRAFKYGKTPRLKSSFQHRAAPDGPLITVNTQAGKLSLLSAYLVATRNYTPLIRELESADDPHTLFKLFGIFLADLSFLQMTGRFAELRAAMIQRVDMLRTERCEAEKSAAKSADAATKLRKLIKQNIYCETVFLFGISLFSFLDQQFDYQQFVLSLVKCDSDFGGDWQEFPENMLRYFSSERVAWSISMLLHLSNQRFREPNVASDFKEVLRELITGYVHRLQAESITLSGIAQSRDAEAGKQERTRLILRAQQNLDLLLADLGARELVTKHQIIRFLRDKIIAPPRRHNPIQTNLALITDEFHEALSPFLLGLGNRERRESIRVHLRSSTVKPRLDDALYTTGVLQDVYRAVNQLFSFTPAVRSELQKYAIDDANDGPPAALRELGDLLEQVRGTGSISQRELERIVELRQDIFSDLWEKKSPLRRALANYNMPLCERLELAMRWANDELRRHRYPDAWEVQLTKLDMIDPDWRVLIERDLLKEVLRNIFLNVRHSFRGFRRRGKPFNELVEFSVSAGGDAAETGDEDVKYAVTRIVSRGVRFNAQRVKSGSTFDRHRTAVADYGGRLSIEPLETNDGAVVELRLILT